MDINLNNKFINSLNEIQSLLISNQLNNEEINSKIINLQSEIETNKHNLPSYQLQQISNKISYLLTKIDNESNNQKQSKFKFKSLKSGKQFPKKIDNDIDLKQQDNNNIIINPTISNKFNEFIQNEQFDLNPILQNINQSIIIINNVNSLQIFDIKDSIIIINENKSSNFIKNVKNSIIFINNQLNSNQTRIHNCLNLKIKSLNSNLQNNIIIENCKNLIISSNILKIDDFNSPLGKSENFKNLKFSTKFDEIYKICNSNPTIILNNLKDYIDIE
ncbi:hypothetical protein WICMUC_005562 [Wickerhamomyces mucosus]|uniref:C-CAP/cofactor C-like domain-containing protein n=1 Tax=Wickerhamomyces mucosus TaxID=1378264 RepID=A0A9P8T615_9ASCO|nr:hypothetical protein WICMUC_005562 [Wickerhamomyces mucosus]